MSDHKRKIAITKIMKITRQNMENLGVYKKEFTSTIQRYSELRVQYDFMYQSWVENGCKITELYTNKNGATNAKKTAEYMAIESLQKELTNLETILGLNPRGLKQLQSKGLEQPKSSKLEQVLLNV